MSHICNLTVRSYEIDTNGHVNNANYLNYLEHARMQFMVDAGIDYDALQQRGINLVVARIDIRYKRPAFLGQNLVIHTIPIKKRRTFGVFSQKIMFEETLIAEAEVTWAGVNREGRPIPLPVEFDGPELTPPSPERL